jgi:hypothetical protein
MVKLSEDPQGFAADIERVVSGACAVQQDHADTERASTALLPEERAAFINKGAAAKTAIIIPIKCVIALPGSRIVICIKKPPFTSENAISSI